MNIFKLSLAVIFTLFVSSPSLAIDGDYPASVQAASGSANMISMDFQNASLKAILKIFSQQAGLNFVAGQNVKDRNVTIYFDNVRVDDALTNIMNANNLIYEQAPGSNIFIVKESGRPEVTTITKIYELKYAQLSTPPTEKGAVAKDPEIVSVLRDLLSESGKIVADKRSNSLIIKDIPSQFSIIEDVLLRLDTRTLQVMIELEVLEVSTTIADQIGMNWSGTFGNYVGPQLGTQWPLKGAIIDKDLITTDGTMKFNAMTFSFSAILSDSDTRILARPKILTLNNETAIIEITADTAVASVTTVASAQGAATEASNTAERIKTGITMEVTPQINKDGYITLHIEPTVTVPVVSQFFAGTGEDSKFVDPHTRSIKTTIMVKDGETIVLGGLISREDTATFQKIPFLGDIPFLGAAFRYKTNSEIEKELIIFITPTVVKETLYLLGDISEREQEKPKAVREKEIKSLLDMLTDRRTR